MPPRSERRDLVAFFGALCLVLSTLEYLIPKPIPFMRVGLANLPILLALRTFDAPTVLLLVALKILGQGLVSGTLFSYVFLFSAAGSLAAGLAMLAGAKLGASRISLVGISVLGALASNLAQVLLATALVFGPGGWLIGPPFVAVGTVSGALLGLFARSFEGSSSWLAARRRAASGEPPFGGRQPGPDPRGSPERPAPRPRRDRIAAMVAPRDTFLAGLAMLPAFLFLHGLVARGALVLLFASLSLLAGRRFRPLFPLMAMAGVVAANLLAPSGRVLCSLGPFPFTAGAIEAGLRKALTFVGLVYLSLFAVRPGIPLPGRLGGLLARMVFYFERLMEEPGPLDRRDLMGSLDRLLWRASGPGSVAPLEASSKPQRGRERTSTSGWALVSFLVILPWSVLLAELLMR